MTKLIIVGGGIAGLVAGVYARQSGMETTILEMHSIPGGNSTSWRRKGYLFEGGMHWLVGSKEGTALNQAWKEVGALQENNPVYYKDPFITYLHQGEKICLYRDVDKLRDHFMKVSPEDKAAINQLVKDIKAVRKVSMPMMDVKGAKVKYKSSFSIKEIMKMLSALPSMNKAGKITNIEYASKFKHPGIRTLLENIVGDKNYTASSVLFTLGGLSIGDSGYPKGGSLQMAQNIANTYTSLGGEIKYNTKVDQVIVKDGKATGVIVNGVVHEADAVIVTMDALSAVHTLFDQPLQDSWVQDMKDTTELAASTFISLGVKTDLKHLPESMLFPLEEPITMMGITYSYLGFYNYANFKGYAPEGSTAMTSVLLGDSYLEWKKVKEEGNYQAKKEEIAKIIIEKLNTFIPETKDKVEVYDVATPLTYERYCGTYHGSWMSVMYPGMKQQQYPLKSNTVKQLYFAGQRMVRPGGLPVALSTGREAVQHVCKDADIIFQGNYERNQ